MKSIVFISSILVTASAQNIVDSNLLESKFKRVLATKQAGTIIGTKGTDKLVRFDESHHVLRLQASSFRNAVYPCDGKFCIGEVVLISNRYTPSLHFVGTVVELFEGNWAIVQFFDPYTFGQMRTIISTERLAKQMACLFKACVGEEVLVHLDQRSGVKLNGVKGRIKQIFENGIYKIDSTSSLEPIEYICNRRDFANAAY